MDNNRSLGYTLHHLSFVLDRQSDQLLQSTYGVGFSQFKIMMVLAKHEGVQQSEIADYLGQTEASVSRQVKLLVELGLVTSQSLSSNRRKRITRLSEKGLEMTAKAIHSLESIQAPMYERLTESERSSLANILKTMHEEVCGVDQQGMCLKKKGL